MSQTEVQLIKDAVIVNADVSNSAAIDVSKLSGVMPLTGGTFSGDITIPDKIIHSGDTNTAIRFSAADTVEIETAGASRLKIDSSGNVTIGNDGDSGSGPSAGYDELCIEGGNEDIGICFISPAANNVKQRIAFGDSNNNKSGEIRYDHQNDDFEFYTAGAERLHISSTGEILSTYDITADGDTLLTLDTDNTSAAPSIEIKAGGERRSRFLMQRLAGDGCSMRIQVSKMDDSNTLLDAITIAPTTSGDTTPDSTFNGDVIANNLFTSSDITHNGDTNNKIIFTTDTQEFVTAGSTRLQIQDDGDILLNDEISTVGSTNAIRTNIPSTRAFGSTSNRNTSGKITIRAGDADNTSIDDDNCAIKIYPAANRAGSGAPAYGGIAWNHLDPMVYNPSVYNGSTCWIGPTVHDLAGQERDNFEIRMNSQTGTGTQPNNVGLRLSPEGYHSFPTTPIFIGEGADYTQNTNNSTYSDVIPEFNRTIRGITRSGASLTVPEDGVYFFTITYLFHPNGNTQHATSRVVVNGSQVGDIIQVGGNDANHQSACFTKLLNLSNNDAVKFQFRTAVGEVHGNQVNWAFYKVA